MADRPDRVPAEVTLVDLLRVSEAWLPALSLVAVFKGEIVGHVLCTRAHLDSEPVLGLGPIGVKVAYQNHGIGSALMTAVIAEADGSDERLIGLLGSPSYYGRFGFVPSSVLGIEPPDPEWSEHFQVLTLSGYDSTFVGRFRYAPAFDLI
jgi:putative acetyltransferase